MKLSLNKQYAKICPPQIMEITPDPERKSMTVLYFFFFFPVEYKHYNKALVSFSYLFIFLMVCLLKHFAQDFNHPHRDQSK